jgi:hypothetical protein
LEKINGELELAKKKKQALDKLFAEGKVSQPTYDSFSNEVAEAIAEIEAKQTALVEKMRSKISELEQQMKTLECLLVNSEIRHVSGEIEEEAYNRECNVLSLGLETTRQELNEIKEAISNLSEQNIGLPPPPPLQVEEEAEASAVEPETEKRLEIVMDTETTTSIETTVEEQPTVEEETEVPVEQVAEPAEQVEPAESVEQVAKQEETVEPPVETVGEFFRQEETPPSEEAEASETSEDTEEAQSEVSQEVQVEEETAQAQE